MSSSSSQLDDEQPRRSLTRVPIWVPISAFVGTSLVLVIPLVMLRRQRAVHRMTLAENNSATPPPRRTTLAKFPNIRHGSPPSTVSSTQENIFADSDGGSPSMPTAFSHLNASSGMLAAKAFAIATGIVTVSGVALVWSVKEILGVKDAREFGARMRALLTSSVPSLSSAIHRPLPKKDEQTGEEGSHGVTSSEIRDWTWEEAERRLKVAYDRGGIVLWAQTALRELEVDARRESLKRGLQNFEK